MLTPEQLRHNFELDQKIRDSEHEFQMRELEAKRKNEEFRKLYPDAAEEILSTYGLNVVGRRTVIGLRYVD
jgi:hypothetical protein